MIPENLMKFSSEKELKLFLKFKMYKYLTSDEFSTPDREYIFLDEDNIIKFKRLDGALEIFDFDGTYYNTKSLYKNYTYRITRRIY